MKSVQYRSRIILELDELDVHRVGVEGRRTYDNLRNGPRRCLQSTSDEDKGVAEQNASSPSKRKSNDADQDTHDSCGECVRRRNHWDDECASGILETVSVWSLQFQ